MKTVGDLLKALEGIPLDTEIADNHLGKLYVADEKTRYREVFDFKERKND